MRYGSARGERGVPDLRVCMVSTSAKRGGAARVATTLTRALNASGLGVRATLFHCDDALVVGDLVGLRRPWSRQVNALLARLAGDNLSFDFGVARELLARAREFDIVHLHNLHGYYLDFRRLLDGLRGRPVVWTWHDVWPITGRCGTTFECTRWQTGCAPCPHRDYYPAAWIDWTARDYRERTRLLLGAKEIQVVTPSKWLSDLGTVRGYQASRFTVIPSPGDLEELGPVPQAEARTALNFPSAGPILIFVASDCDAPHKGLDDYLYVVEKLGVRGIVVGHSKRGPQGCVDFVGPIASRERLALLYSAADALIVPSLSDNYPNTAIEAQACGTPVFAYRVGGLPEQMPPFLPGLAEPHDRDGLAKLVADFLRDGGKTENLSSRLRDHAVATWKPAVVAERYRDLYLRVLARSAR
jgi:putative colanic acid biosynthesis glycosyltransferase